jgi:two-component system sensor histidine kinase/response regulator
MTSHQGNILVVDDTPDNLRLLSAMLSEKGYKVRKALSGQTALNTVKTLHPDIILLDINMPSMNGYQVCEILKAEPQTQEIPVIFISALDDVLDKVTAFAVGGADYITKPFQAEEVLVRLENQLIICRQKQQLKQEIAERQKAEEALRVYLHAVSHDLRNPVLGMSMVLNNLLKRHCSTSATEPSNYVSIPISILERMKNSCERQLVLINSLVETQQFDIWGVPLKREPLKLNVLIDELVAEWQPMIEENQATLENKIAGYLPLVNADHDQLWRVFENLIANALKHNLPGLNIAINAEVILGNGEQIRCTVTDNGVGIEKELSKNLFERYQRGKQAKRTRGLGLGLYLCRQIIQAHGGDIGVISEPGKGSQFWFTLPISRVC